MNIRIQTYGKYSDETYLPKTMASWLTDNIFAEDTTVWDALQKGLDDLMDLCNVVEEKFIAARDEFMANRMEA